MALLQCVLWWRSEAATCHCHGQQSLQTSLLPATRMHLRLGQVHIHILSQWAPEAGLRRKEEHTFCPGESDVDAAMAVCTAESSLAKTDPGPCMQPLASLAFSNCHTVEPSQETSEEAARGQSQHVLGSIWILYCQTCALLEILRLPDQDA